MIEISPELVTILMLVGLIVAILTGFPLALAVGSVGRRLLQSSIANLILVRG